MTDQTLRAWHDYVATNYHYSTDPYANFRAGVVEGRKQAREAAMNVDPIESALGGSDAAVAAIDALKDIE